MSKRAEETIIESTGQPGFAAESSQYAFAVSEGAGHLLRSVNPALCRLFGKPPSAFLGKPFAEAIADDSAVNSLLDHVYLSGAAASLDPVRSFECSAPSPNPDCLDSRIYLVSPLLSASGEPGGLVIQIADASEQGAVDPNTMDAIRTANQRLLLAALREEERAEALLRGDRAKDEFLAMLAHELRNPLAAIRTGVYLVSRRAGEFTEDLHRPCDLITNQIRHLSRLLDDLLDVSRIKTGKIQLRPIPTGIVPIVDHALATIRPVIEQKQHEMLVTLPSEALWVNADPVRLGQAITNLLHNAAKYTHPGGQIWLTVEKDPGATDGPDADGKSTPMGAGEVVVRVRDSGVGIREDSIASIFEPFVQTAGSPSQSQGGLGIGLTLVRRLVEMHGGRVDAYSSGVDQGSEFIIRLPLYEGDNDATAQVDHAPRVPEIKKESSGQHVLVVDDNADLAALLQDVLKLWGYAAEVVHSGNEAIGAALSAPPDVILLDIGLSGMTGYEVAETLRKKTDLDRTLLVALTGFGQESDRARAIEAGFDFHLTKPVDLDELRATIAAGRRSGTKDEG